MTDPSQPSPAAQAVLAAYGNQIGGIDAIMNSERRGLAAVLRHLAAAHGDPESFGAVRPERLEQLAAQLEGQP